MLFPYMFPTRSTHIMADVSFILLFYCVTLCVPQVMFLYRLPNRYLLYATAHLVYRIKTLPVLDILSGSELNPDVT